MIFYFLFCNLLHCYSFILSSKISELNLKICGGGGGGGAGGSKFSY